MQHHVQSVSPLAGARPQSKTCSAEQQLGARSAGLCLRCLRPKQVTCSAHQKAPTKAAAAAAAAKSSEPRGAVSVLAQRKLRSLARLRLLHNGWHPLEYTHSIAQLKTQCRSTSSHRSLSRAARMLPCHRYQAADRRPALPQGRRRPCDLHSRGHFRNSKQKCAHAAKKGAV